MIVAGDDQNAAMGRGAIGIAVLECIAGAIDARSLAVPEAEHALDLTPRTGLDLLRAEHRSSGEVLVDRGQKFDAALLEEALGAPQLEIDAAERRAAIAGHEASGVEAVRAIALLLLEQHAHQRLRPGEQHAAGCPRVAIQ